MLDFINDQALNTPDIPDRVPFVAGTVRGKKWVPPPKPKDNNFGLDLDDSIELDIDLGDETEKALKGASTSDIIDLAGTNTYFYKIIREGVRGHSISKSKK